MKYVAVVNRPDADYSLGTNGAWTAFIGEDQDEVITRALKHREGTQMKYPDYTYQVLVGSLEFKAVAKAEYKLVKINKGESA